MGLILDTSAIIGWLERGSDSVVAAIREHDDVPLMHAVSLGELEAGVANARREGDRLKIETRTNTLDFARDKLTGVTIDPGGEQPYIFGLLSAGTSRKLSQNDKWIASAAISGRHTLVTQDEGLSIVLRDLSLEVEPDVRVQFTVRFCPID